MPRLRKLLTTLAITAGIITLVSGLLWYKFSANISPEMWLHAENVVQGQASLSGDRTPGELIRYANRRLEGHPNLEALVHPPLLWVQAKVERPVPLGPLPTLGKGQQPESPSPLPGQSPTPNIYAATPQELIKAYTTAQAGQTILLAPGNYRINQNLRTQTGGTALQRITLRASQPGQAQIEFNAQEGFIVAHPYWVFENLTIRGACPYPGNCEHAFHVVGNGAHLVVRNNTIVDFNSHLKINGLEGNWPDNGVLQHNTITNTTPRTTQSPTTPFDLVAASRWQVLDNIVSNFVKNGSNGISYGIFMKGAGSGGRIERNLVICTPQDVSQPGVRVGISFGGGTTGAEFCRDQLCIAEHTAGLAANNIVAHCNDFGIDINRSTSIVIAHNTLINTAGIDVRDASSAKLYGNLLEGRMRQRKGGQATLEMNEIANLRDVFEDPNALNLTWRKAPDNIPSILLVPKDFYGQARSSGTPPGALVGGTP